MIFLKKIKSNSINAQIIFAFVTLTTLIIALEVLAYAWIRQMVVINSLKESSAMLKESQMLMKSASNEFILREKTNEQFFASGKSNFLERYTVYSDQLQNNMNEIRAKGASLNITDYAELDSLKISINEYNNVFRQMVEKIQKRGYGKYGLIGEFDKSIGNLLQYDFGTDNTAIINLQLYVKDYLLTGNKELINNISNEVFNFTMVLETHIKDEEVEKVSGILLNYENVFTELTRVDSELGIYTGGGLQSRLFSAIDTLDKAVQLEKINTRINEAYADNLFKLYLSFFLVVSAAIVAAFIINRRLYKSLVIPIQEMRSIITKMSRGEVPESSLHFKVDDLKEMALALNNLVAGTRNYQNFANNIGKGNLNTPFTPLSDRDILGRSLITMRESLKKNAEEDKKRAWAAEGLAEIGTLLRAQATSDSELYNNILQFIVKYTSCNQGSLFLIRDDGETESYLELVACYAWHKRKYLEKRIELGSGLVGQCVLEKEVIHMTNFPSDYIKITSGLGEACPNSLLIVPLKVDNQVSGVLELASFESFEGYQIDLISKFAESLAAAVNIDRINTRTKLLLHQAELQTEKLQEQEAKLRLKIEELEHRQNQIIPRLIGVEN